MQNRFKFRVFDKVANKHIDLKDFRKGEIEFNFDPDTQTIWIEYDKSRYVVEQCTGLRDKNGKLIFEGDIVKSLSEFVLEYKGEIKFGKKENYQSFYVDWHTKHPIMRGDIYYWLEDKDEGLEVIGNIYENPELLGGAE